MNRLVLCVFMGMGLISYAQKGQYNSRITHFSRQDYLGQNQNWSIHHLPNGCLLVGNSEGLMIFDGTKWSIYRLPNSQIVRAVEADEKGNIYVGGFEELGVWRNNSEGQLEYESFTKLVPNALLEKEEIWGVTVTYNSVYFQSFGKIYKYFKDGRIEVLEPSPSNGIMFIENTGRSVLVPEHKGSLFRLEPDNTFVKVPSSDFFVDKKIVFVLPISQGILVATEDAGIYVLDESGVYSWSDPADSILRAKRVNKGLKLNNGHIAIGTILSGVFVFDASGQLVRRYNKQNGLQNNTVLSLHQDLQGNLWVGLDSGIDLIELNSPLQYFSDSRNQLGTVYTAALFNDLLYIGTNQGLFYARWEDNAVDSIQFYPVSNTRGQVWNLSVLGEELFCLHTDFTVVIDEFGNAEIPLNEGSWSVARSEGSPDIVYVGTYSGVVVLKKLDGEWQFLRRLDFDNFSYRVKKLLFDASGDLWVLDASRGVAKISLSKDGTEVESIKQFSEADGLSSTYDLDILFTSNVIVVSSIEGFFSFENGRFAKLEVLSPEVSLQENDYKIIKGTNNEWFKIYEEHVKLVGGTHDELLFLVRLVSPHENIVSIASKQYLFCLEDGFALYDRRKIDFSAPVDLSPLISKVSVKSSSQELTVHNDGLSNSIRESTFGPGATSLSIQFADLSFGHDISFKYKLKGFDTNWHTSSSHVKEYTNLSPGNYTFSLKLTGSTELTEFDFRIDPDWYQTIAFKVVVTLLIVICLVIAFTLSRRSDKRRRKLLRLEHERQLHQQKLTILNEELQKEVQFKEGELANSTMSLIRKNEVLQEIKKKISGLRKKVRDDASVREINRILITLREHMSNQSDWEVFEQNFNNVHSDFFKKLKTDFPDLSNSDLKLASYLKMNLSTKEIAQLLNVSSRSLDNKRYLLRKKLKLAPGANLIEFIIVNY